MPEHFDPQQFLGTSDPQTQYATFVYSQPPMASGERLGLFADFLRLFKRISLLKLTDVTRHSPNFSPIRSQDTLDYLPEVHAFEVDTATSLSFVQYLGILTAIADRSSISSIHVCDLIGSAPVESYAQLPTLPNLQTLTLDGFHSARVLRGNIASFLPGLRSLTVCGFVSVDRGPTAFTTWQNLRLVAECAIPSVREVILRIRLTARPTDPPLPVLDGDLRYSLRGQDWALLDAVLGVYDNVTLELCLQRTALALSSAQFPHVVRLVEDVARDRMSARAREKVHLHVY